MKHDVKDLPYFSRIDAWVNEFRLSDYMEWFEKINPHTAVWQIVVIIILWCLRKEIKAFIEAIIKRVPYIKSVGAGGVETHPETREIKVTRVESKKRIEKLPEETQEKLTERIEAYAGVAHENPNIVFLSVYFEVEILLFKLYVLVFTEDDQYSSRGYPLTKFRKLAGRKILTSSSRKIFRTMHGLRNKISHGEKPLKNVDTSQVFLKTLFLLKEEIAEAIKKHEQK